MNDSFIKDPFQGLLNQNQSSLAAQVSTRLFYIDVCSPSLQADRFITPPHLIHLGRSCYSLVENQSQLLPGVTNSLKTFEPCSVFPRTPLQNLYRQLHSETAYGARPRVMVMVMGGVMVMVGGGEVEQHLRKEHQ